MHTRLLLTLLLAATVGGPVFAQNEDYRLRPDRRLPWKIAKPESQYGYKRDIRPKPTEQVWVSREFVDDLQRMPRDQGTRHISRWSQDPHYRHSTLMRQEDVREQMQQGKGESTRRTNENPDTWQPEGVYSAPETSYAVPMEDVSATDLPSQPVPEKSLEDMEREAQKRLEEEYTRREADEYRDNVARRERVNDAARQEAFEPSGIPDDYRTRAFEANIGNGPRISPFVSPPNDRSRSAYNNPDVRISPFNSAGRADYLDDQDYVRDDAERVNAFTRRAEPIRPGTDPYDNGTRRPSRDGEYAGPTRISPFGTPPSSTIQDNEPYGEHFEDAPVPLITRPFGS